MSLYIMWHDQQELVGYQRSCFSDIGKERGQIILFYIVFSADKLLITLSLDIKSLWGLHKNVAFLCGQMVVSKTKNVKSSTCDSFNLIMSYALCLFISCHFAFEEDPVIRIESSGPKPIWYET